MTTAPPNLALEHVPENAIEHTCAPPALVVSRHLFANELGDRRQHGRRAEAESEQEGTERGHLPGGLLPERISVLLYGPTQERVQRGKIGSARLDLDRPGIRHQSDAAVAAWPGVHRPENKRVESLMCQLVPERRYSYQMTFVEIVD